MVWDKGEGVRPQPGRFSNQCEYAVWGSKGKLPLERKAWSYEGVGGQVIGGTGTLPGVFDYPAPEEDWDEDPIPGIVEHGPVRSDRAGKVHITQKPVRLIKHLMQASVAGATVLDPFVGSGTTLVACRQMRRKGIGIEVDPALVPAIKKRVQDNR